MWPLAGPVAEIGSPRVIGSAIAQIPSNSQMKKFVGTVRLQDDIKEWGLRTITLMRMSPAPEEWVYAVHFDAVPKASSWNAQTLD